MKQNSVLQTRGAEIKIECESLGLEKPMLWKFRELGKENKKDRTLRKSNILRIEIGLESYKKRREGRTIKGDHVREAHRDLLQVVKIWNDLRWKSRLFVAKTKAAKLTATPSVQLATI